jgi:hypothetical protein
MARTSSLMVRQFDKSIGRITRNLSFTGSCRTRPVTVFFSVFAIFSPRNALLRFLCSLLLSVQFSFTPGRIALFERPH